MFLRVFFILLIILYIGLFQAQEKSVSDKSDVLSMASAAPFQKIILGYLKEVGAEILYVKQVVYLGKYLSQEKPEGYENVLAHNFEVATELYPEFVDSYFVSESSLAHLGKESALRVNKILVKGESVLDENTFLPFFRGFNLFYYLDQPKEAAVVFRQLADRPGAPQWFGHLAGVLSARGGDLYGGLMTLKAMLSTEENEAVRDRYNKDIEIFEKAISVQSAIGVFFTTYNRYPETLDELVPVFLTHIPDVGSDFVLKWDSPELHLLRPD